MKRLLISFLLLFGHKPIHGQIPPNTTYVYSFNGTQLPSLCNNGDWFHNVLTYTWYQCGPTNTWNTVSSNAIINISDCGNLSFTACVALASGKTLLIDQTVTFTSATVPPNVGLLMAQNGFFNNSGTLTIQGGIGFIPDVHTIFIGSGPISFLGNTVLDKVNDRWWTTADGSTNDSTALHACAVASVSGSIKLPVYMPAGVRRVCNVHMQDLTGCDPTMGECPTPPRVFGVGGIAPNVTTIKATSACGSNSSDFVIIQNTSSKAGFDNITIDGGGTTTPGTGSSGMDLSWLAGNGAAVLRNDHDLHFTGCKDAVSSYCLKYNNNGSSILKNVLMEPTTGEVTSGNLIAISAITPGDVISFDNLKVYNGGLTLVDAQTGSLHDTYMLGGLRISGTGTNDWSISGDSQIEVNKISGIVVDCLNVSVYACENLNFNGTYIAPSGLAGGQSLFNGSILGGVEIHGGHITLGSGAWAGTITTSQTGFPAKFTGWNTFINGTLPVNNAQYLVEWHNVINGGKTVSSTSGPGAYFASIASATALAIPSSTPNLVISGTTTVTSVTGLTAGAQGTFITTGAVPFTAGNNIGNSCTTTASKLYVWYYDGSFFWTNGTGC